MLIGALIKRAYLTQEYDAIFTPNRQVRKLPRYLAEA